MIAQHQLMIPVPEAAAVWRYMSLDKYESLLKTSSLFFCRSDKFSDPFEGSIPRKESEFKLTEQRYADAFFGHEYDEVAARKRVEQSSKVQKDDKVFTMVNCWHINNIENDGMWQLYLKDNEGIAIRSTMERLTIALKPAKEEIYISKIRYLDYDNDIWYHAEEYPRRGYNFLTAVIHKRKEFEHEKELRLFHQVPFDHKLREKYWDGQPNKIGIFVEVDIVTLVEGVHFAPTADDKTKNAIAEITKEYGYNFEFFESKLKSDPYY
jgi:hypothetical protein